MARGGSGCASGWLGLPLADFDYGLAHISGRGARRRFCVRHPYIDRAAGCPDLARAFVTMQAPRSLAADSVDGERVEVTL